MILIMSTVQYSCRKTWALEFKCIFFDLHTKSILYIYIFLGMFHFDQSDLDLDVQMDI